MRDRLYYSEAGDRIESTRPVLVSRYRGFTRANHWVTAISLIALLLPGALLFFSGWLSAWQLLLVQWATFIVLALLFRLPGVTSRLIPRSVRCWRACNLARRQFIELNLHHTEADTGVLIFVSEAERYVEILVDRGISSRIDNAAWESIVGCFTERVKQGQVLEGFLGCIEASGALLAQHVPKTHERNELPNRLVLLP